MRLVGPIERDGGRKGDEEVLERYGRLASDESVAKARPGVG